MHESSADDLRRGKKVLFLQYTNPAGYPPLEHVCGILAERGWKLVFLGTRVGQSAALRFSNHPRVVVRLIGSVAPGWIQKAHYAAYVFAALVYAVVWRPRWIYASDPLSCIPATLITRVLGIQVVYHEHDEPASSGASGFWRTILAARRTLARLAQVNVIPNHKRAERFAAAHRLPIARVACVLNCPSRSEVPDARAPREEQEFWLYYHGSINAERLPPAVIRSLALLPEQVGVRIVGYETAGSRGYLAELRLLARQYQVADRRLDILGTIERRSEMLDVARSSQVGLSLMPMRTRDPNMANMIGASNKPFDYLACGIPVLVSNLPEWNDTFVRPGYGLACNPESPESIANAVRWWLENPAEFRIMGQRGRARILEEWNYEQQFAPVLELLQGADIR